MVSNLIPKKIDYTQNSYISNLDLVNKYNLSDKKKIPSLNKIILLLPLTQFTDNFTDTNITEFDSEVQIKSILILYLLTLNIPYINFKKLKVIKSKENHLSLKITLNDNYLINQFLTRLFIEQKDNLISDLKVLKQKDLKINAHFSKLKVINYTSSILIQNFFEINLLLNRVLSGMNSNEFFIKINFIFKKPVKIQSNYKNLIKNCPLFWING